MNVVAHRVEARPRHLWRSTGAVLLGLIVVIATSLGTDQVLHVLRVYPPWGEAMRDTGLLLLATAYRCVYAVLGSYVAAHFAPRHRMRHALVLGVVGFVLASIGAIATIPLDLGPAWYPVLLVLTALPCAWLGGVLYRRRHPMR
jgi:hypothetical protein